MDINIILILLTIHMALIIILKPKSENLSCGIFGWAGKSARSFNKAKFDILGLYNNSRGGDSCGVSTDGEIYYGILTSKNYADFLYKEGYGIPKTNPVVIGHTRKSSSGAVNSVNAHPFGFGDIDSKFEFVGVHNGTLHNQDDLAKKYNLDVNVEKKNSFGVMSFDRRKIDSEILLEIIYKEKNFRVLSDYIGGAALLFTNTNEPNILYVFKGASRVDSDDKGADLEERPLYYYKENKNNLYISSIQESLETIGGVPNQDLFKFKENTLYKIKDGNIDLSEKLEISRRQAHQRPFTEMTNYGYCGYNFKRESAHKAFEKEEEKTKKDGSVINIREEKEERIFKSPIVFNKLRYSRNGHLINGIYTWIREYGFIELASDHKEANLNREKLINKAFDVRLNYFVEEKDMFPQDKDIIYPFTSKNKVVPAIFYFYEGILLENKLDFDVLSAKARNYNIWELSEMSKNPIIELEPKNSNYANSYIYKKILHKRNPFTGNIVPLGSSKVYYIENGELVKTITINKPSNEKSKLTTEEQNTDNQQQELKLLLENNNSDELLIKKEFETFCQKNELEIKDFSNDNEEDSFDLEILEEEEVVVEYTNNLMLPIYLKIQESVLLLSDFDKSNMAKEIIELNEDYLMSLDEIIEKTYR